MAPKWRCGGRFYGNRVNCEQVPALPVWAVRWVMDDPRKVPYLLVWKSPWDGEVKEAVRVSHCSDPGPFYGSNREFFYSPRRGVLRCNWVEIKRANRTCVFVRTMEQSLPRRGGRALLLVCPECGNPCRALYGWEPGGEFTCSAQRSQWQCRTCAGLRYASEGGALAPSGRGWIARAFRPVHLPRPEPWYPYVFSSLDQAAEVIV